MRMCRLCKSRKRTPRPATRRMGGLVCESCYRRSVRILQTIRLAFGVGRYGVHRDANNRRVQSIAL